LPVGNPGRAGCVFPQKSTLKLTKLRNLPFNSLEANAAWLETIIAATDLINWTKLIGLTERPELARCEVATVL
jgi:hypothetical protein